MHHDTITDKNSHTTWGNRRGDFLLWKFESGLHEVEALVEAGEVGVRAREAEQQFAELHHQSLLVRLRLSYKDIHAASFSSVPLYDQKSFSRLLPLETAEFRPIEVKQKMDRAIGVKFLVDRFELCPLRALAPVGGACGRDDGHHHFTVLEQTHLDTGRKCK